MTLHIALIEPRIPPNTGNIARLCAATDTPLHLIEPLGFSIDEREVRRAGLDYWDKTDLWVHPNWFRFRDAIARERCLYFSANAEQDYTTAPFTSNSVLIFGNETDGMPQRILDKHPERCFRIPMPGGVRSLNLANAVSIVLYEGMRQLGVGDALPEPMEFEEPDEFDALEALDPPMPASSAPPSRMPAAAHHGRRSPGSGRSPGGRSGGHRGPRGRGRGRGRGPGRG
ncbi:MAG TPA: tRNA (cytidine(34)-2'-O)-methyltransferase [Gemmatimonadales bacterium]|nr:tRNA (cytidine(34)-2'-O)-methyltransferase [Gemmatimonadales bacterium]